VKPLGRHRKVRSAIHTFGSFAACLAVAHTALAHHSPAAFDQQREITLTGVVRQLEWTNPHVYLHLSVSEGNGSARWTIEAQSPTVLSMFGWSASAVSIGDLVVIEAHPARNDRSGMALGRSVRKADGSVLRIPWEPAEIREAIRMRDARGIE
jgi:hypothetical protein